MNKSGTRKQSIVCFSGMLLTTFSATLAYAIGTSSTSITPPPSVNPAKMVVTQLTTQLTDCVYNYGSVNPANYFPFNAQGKDPTSTLGNPFAWVSSANPAHPTDWNVVSNQNWYSCPKDMVMTGAQLSLQYGRRSGSSLVTFAGAIVFQCCRLVVTYQ